METRKHYIAYKPFNGENTGRAIAISHADSLEEIIASVKEMEEQAIVYSYDIVINNIYDGDRVLKAEELLENERKVLSIE